MALHLRPYQAGKLPRVLLLNWGVVGGAAGSPFTGEDMHDWLALAHQRLVGACPPGVRIVSLLSFQVEHEPGTFESLAALATDPGPLGPGDSRQVHHQPLPPVGDVHVDDIDRNLRDPDCSRCPTRQVSAVARAIWAESKGNFEKTVTILQRARRLPANYAAWAEVAPPPSSTPPTQTSF